MTEIFLGKSSIIEKTLDRNKEKVLFFMEEFDMRILISAVGTTDPIRGFRDGSMLHIVRHYRPERVILFISKEMGELEKKDNRYLEALTDFQKRNSDYRPQIERIYCDVEDVSEFDVFYDDFEKTIQQESKTYPDAEILLNLSSGTIQMKITLAFLAMDLRYKTTGIQVKNPDKKSGTADRSNSDKYDLALEIALNEDNEAGAEKRCIEPELFLIRRQAEKEKIQALLEAYDYRALTKIRVALPPACRKLVEQLNLRSSYDVKAAKEMAQNIKMPFNLYPQNPEKRLRIKKEYDTVSEYLLCLKLMQKRGDLTQFVLRLNPLIIVLQQRYLEDKCGLKIADLKNGNKRRPLIDRRRIHEYSPDLERFLDEKFGVFRDNTDLGIKFINCIIEFLGKAETEEGKLFFGLEELNQEQRNKTAHNLDNTTEEDIKNLSGKGSWQIVDLLEKMIVDLYQPICNPKIFRIYDMCNEYILQML